MLSSAKTVAVSGHYDMLTGIALLIGDSPKARLRFTNNNTSASCALHSILVLFHPNSLHSVWRSDRSALVGHDFTKSRFSCGTPHKVLPLTTPRHCDAPLFIICSLAQTAATPHRSTTATPFLPRRSSITALFSFRQRHDFTSFGLGYHEVLMDHLNSIVGICDYSPNPLASQLTFLWGSLVSLTTCLKIIGGVTGIFTEADLHTTLYFFYAKKALVYHLPVDLLGSSSSKTASFLISVSLPNVKWKCLSISITILLSCVPVHLGSEDATDFVSMILWGADLVSTSQFKVTNSQASSIVVNLSPTHSSFAMNSLSFYHRGISISSLYGVLLVVGRVCLKSFLDCSSYV